MSAGLIVASLREQSEAKASHEEENAKIIPQER
jgi:hypothetical protein